jgi:hypothetical protein
MNKFTRFMIVIIMMSMLWNISGVYSDAGNKFDIPETIMVEQCLEQPVANWEAGKINAPHILQRLSIYDGHPSNKASLIPDQTKTNEQGQQVAIWQLTNNKEDQYWITCSYTGTSVEYIRPIPSTASVCEVTYNSQISVIGYPAIESIVFK